VCDFRDVTVEGIGKDRVRVGGAKGTAPTPNYKVSATYSDGFRATAALVIAGRDAVAKGRTTGAAILARVERLLESRALAPLTETRVEVIGSEDYYGAKSRGADAREVAVRISARHPERRALEIFAGEIAPAGVSMAQGTTGISGGRPTPSPVVRLFSFLYEKRRVPVCIELDGRSIGVAISAHGPAAAPAADPRQLEETGARRESRSHATVEVPLYALAFGRSGDKGDTCNIGIIARRPEYVPLMDEQLTAARVAAVFAHCVDGPVTRFALPGLHAFNFVLENALGGGGVASLRYDPQGKAYAQILLDETIDVPAEWLRPGGELAHLASEDS
jgi:hypothetical protein